MSSDLDIVEAGMALMGLAFIGQDVPEDFGVGQQQGEDTPEDTGRPFPLPTFQRQDSVQLRKAQQQKKSSGRRKVSFTADPDSAPVDNNPGMQRKVSWSSQHSSIRYDYNGGENDYDEADNGEEDTSTDEDGEDADDFQEESNFGRFSIYSCTTNQ